MLEQRDRLRVSPVHVVQHEADGDGRRELDERTGNGGEEQEPLRLRVGALRFRHVGHTPRQLAHQAGELAAMAGNVALQHLRRRVRDELRARGDPRLVRHAELLRARSPQHGEAFAVRTVCGQ